MRTINFLYFLCTLYYLSYSFCCGSSRQSRDGSISQHRIKKGPFYRPSLIRTKRAWLGDDNQEGLWQSAPDYYRYASYETFFYFPWSEWSSCLPQDCHQERCLACPIVWYPFLNYVKHIDRCEPWSFNCPKMDRRPCIDQFICRRFQERKLCGVRKQLSAGSLMLKILGGQRSEPHSWPWQVSLELNSKSYFCGGVLIHPRWVMTAVHCIKSYIDKLSLGIHGLQELKEASIFVRVGDHFRYSNDLSEERIQITHYIIYPEYTENAPYKKYDVVLLKLKTEAKISAHVSPICLPAQGTVLPEDTSCWISGWGKTGVTDDGKVVFPAELHDVMLRLDNQLSCQKKMPYDTDISDLVCTKTETKDSCRGDSGGGLYCNIGGTERYQLYGITSFGVGEECHNSTGYYVNVAQLSGWVSEQVETHSNN